jgi:hypothetical protein
VSGPDVLPSEVFRINTQTRLRDRLAYRSLDPRTTAFWISVVVEFVIFCYVGHHIFHVHSTVPMGNQDVHLGIQSSTSCAKFPLTHSGGFPYTPPHLKQILIIHLI